MSALYEHRGKRILDVLISGFGLLLALPVVALTAAAIRLDDGGPIIFTQDRVGKEGTLFRIHKFRSMPVGIANIPSANAETLPITRVGRFLRRTNLDEIPQLVNVLFGSMSLVGPRPALRSQTELLHFRRENGAMDAVPGLTGLAQVNGYDGMPDAQKAEFDGIYSRSICLRSDLIIMMRTVTYLLKPPPRY